MTPREKHIAEMQRLAAAISKTKSEKLKTDYQKRLKKMAHELKIYDSYRREKCQHDQSTTQSHTI